MPDPAPMSCSELIELGVTFNRDEKFDIQLDDALINERRLGEIFAVRRIRKIELKSETWLWRGPGHVRTPALGRSPPHPDLVLRRPAGRPEGQGAGMNAVTVLDLFCGAAGGWSFGLARAGFRTVAACEIDPWRRAVFAAAHPQCVMYSDIRDLDAARLVRDLGYLPDIIVGSPPCQDASVANHNGAGVDGERTGLFFEAIRLVGEIRPAWCAFENVPGLRARGYDRIHDALGEAGYAAWPLMVGAADIGANHRRDRVWIIAVAVDADRGTLWQQSGRGEPRRARAPESRIDAAADPIGFGKRPWASAGAQKPAAGPPFDGDGRAAGNPDRARQPVGSGLARHDGSQLSPALRAVGASWPHWNGGLASLAAACAAAGSGGVDDGLPAGLAPGARNRCISAYGDAVVPQIPEMIGRAMKRLEIMP